MVNSFTHIISAGLGVLLEQAIAVTEKDWKYS